MINPEVIDAAPREDIRQPPRQAAQSYWKESWTALRANRFGMVAGGVVLFMVVVALTAPFFANFVLHHQYFEQDLENNFAAPFTAGHVLGTDELGRDTLVRLMYGAQISLAVAFLTVALSLSVGTTVGLWPVTTAGISMMC